jgi:catechol 2,3-dioxygenase-like lactoylglutathione lyase family enzyme
MSMDLSLAGVTLHVADVEQSLAFYQRLPGAEVIFHIPNRFALLRFGDARLGLLSDRKRQFHLEFECAELDSTYERFQQLGISTEGPPTVRAWGERDFLLLDPDGNLVECGQRRSPQSTEG